MSCWLMKRRQCHHAYGNRQANCGTEWRKADARIEALNSEFVELARNDPAARKLTQFTASES